MRRKRRLHKPEFKAKVALSAVKGEMTMAEMVKKFDVQAAQITQAVRWGRKLRLGSAFRLNVEHSWYKWLPAEESSKYSDKAYGDSSPNFYAKQPELFEGFYYGKDNAHGGQLCICNSQVSKAFSENIIKYAKKTGQRNFSLSPNDGRWDCQCDCCLQDNSKFQAGTPELSSQVIDFSNRIVESVVKEIPDAKFGLYAYNWAVEPPLTVKASPQIGISDVYNGLPYRYYKEQEFNEINYRMKGWREHTSNVVLTSYYTLYGHYSLPWSTM